MIAIVVSIIMVFSILISAFLSFSPNFSRLIEKDFMRRTYNNTISYSLVYGQLSIRADTLRDGDQIEIILPLRDKGQDSGAGISWQSQDEIKSTISIVNNIEVKVIVNRQLSD